MHDLGEIVRFADCELDFARSELRRSGALVALQPTPLRVLLYLAEHRDRTVPRRELLDAIWPGVVVGDESLTTALAEVRHAVGDDGAAQRVIRTLKGAGYRFVAEALVAQDDASGGEVARALEYARRRRRRVWFASAAGALVLASIAAAVWLRPAALPDLSNVPFGVAVLPIQSFTSNPADQELADGLTEQITHVLSQHGYPVVARTTASLWRKRAADVRELGTTLGVSHVLEGSVRRDRDRLRVTMQVASTGSGKQVWSDVFEMPSGDVFAIQDKITDRVAHEVYLRVWDFDPQLRSIPGHAKLAEDSLAFVRAFLDGRWQEALALGERLNAAMPNREPYLRGRAQNLAMMSMTWANLFVWKDRPFGEAGPKMLSLAEQAVASAPDVSYTHGALSRALAHHWRWEEAEREMRRACEITPRDGLVCGAFKAQLCAALGCVEEQLEGARLYAERVAAANANGFYLPWALINNNRLEEAEGVSLRAREIDPTAAEFLGNLQWRLGHQAELLEGWRRWVEANGDRETMREFEQVAAKGDAGLWRWLAGQQAAGRLSPPNMNDFAAAQTYAELGDMELALQELERSVAEHEPGMEMFGLDPIFDPVRDTSRFRALIEKMGLTAYHAKYLRRPRR